MEEETFDYNKLRYILDKNGYVCHASLGALILCDLGECTEYNGDVPNGYETIEEWYEREIERLNAWKISEGNLVYDPNRYEILQIKCEKEHEDNRYVCHKEISNLTNIIKGDSAENYLTSTSNKLNIVEITDSNKFASSFIKLYANKDITNKITIKSNTGNFLYNDATSKNESGIYYEVNPDRTINIYGEATEDVEFDIGGTRNNTLPLLGFKKNVNYYLSSNNLTIKMYNYDGIDRTEIYNGKGGIINFTDSDKIVTHIALYIPKGKTINEVLKPMLNVGDTAKEYITYQGNETIVYLEDNTFTQKDVITIDNGETLLKSVQYPSSDVQISKGLRPSETLTPSENLKPSDEVVIKSALYPSNTTYVGYTNIIQLDNVIMPITYSNLTCMYCLEDIDLIVTYPNIQRNNDLTGYETPNGGFAIDEEGNCYTNNMYANNGYFNGVIEATGGSFTGDINAANINGSTIKGSGFKGTTKDSIELQIGTDSEDKILPTDNSLILLRNDETMLRIGSRYWNAPTLRQLVFYGNTRVFSFKGNIDDELGTLVNTDTFRAHKAMESPEFRNTSLENTKKNFELFENGLDIIKDTDIYKYNLKTQKDGSKKHIGLVIGDDYKYSKEITNEENNAVDLYSMISVCFKAIQEQQEQINELKNIINKLESEAQNE